METASSSSSVTPMMGESNEDAPLEDLSQLACFNEEQLGALTGMTVSFLLDPDIGEYQKGIKAFGGKHNYKIKQMKQLSRVLLLALQRAMKEGWNISELQRKMIGAGLPEALTKSVAAQWKRRSGLIAKALLTRTTQANQLIDVDWSFGVTASCSETYQVGRTYLQLKLTVDRADGKGYQKVYLELSLENFYLFLAELEKCNSILKALR